MGVVGTSGSKAHPRTVSVPPETLTGSRAPTGLYASGATDTVWQPIPTLPEPLPTLIAYAHTVCDPAVSVSPAVKPWFGPAPGWAAPMSERGTSARNALAP